jgi:hypothetical protein
MNTTAVPVSPFHRLKLLVLLAALPAMLAAADVQAWLIRNPDSPESIMSTDPTEKDRLIKASWSLSGTGVLHTEAADDSAPLHRMVRTTPKAVSRMLAANPAEVAAALKAGYETEGKLGFVALTSAPELVPVYRYSKEKRLLWLISPSDQVWAKKDGWKQERVAFWLWPVAVK